MTPLNYGLAMTLAPEAGRLEGRESAKPESFDSNATSKIETVVREACSTGWAVRHLEGKERRFAPGRPVRLFELLVQLVSDLTQDEGLKLLVKEILEAFKLHDEEPREYKRTAILEALRDKWNKLLHLAGQRMALLNDFLETLVRREIINIRKHGLFIIVEDGVLFNAWTDGWNV